MWMNEYDIEDAPLWFADEAHPKLYKAAIMLVHFKDWTNRNSDGWPYWTLPGRAAKALMERLQEAAEPIRSGRDCPDLTDGELTALMRPVRAFLTRQKADPDAVLNPPPPPVYRNPLAEILSAVEEDTQPGIELTRGQLEAWVGRDLTDEELVLIEECIPNSSIPEAIATIADSIEERTDV